MKVWKDFAGIVIFILLLLAIILDWSTKTILIFGIVYLSFGIDNRYEALKREIQYVRRD